MTTVAVKDARSALRDWSAWLPSTEGTSLRDSLLHKNCVSFLICLTLFIHCPLPTFLCESPCVSDLHHRFPPQRPSPWLIEKSEWRFCANTVYGRWGGFPFRLQNGFESLEYETCVQGIDIISLSTHFFKKNLFIAVMPVIFFIF